MVTRRRGSEQARLDDLGNDPGQVGPDSAGQAGDPQQLSSIEDSTNESVLELADTDQALEAAAVDGIEDAADHPERPVHTHLDYSRPEDLPPAIGSEWLDGEEDTALAEQAGTSRSSDAGPDIDVEDLPDERTKRKTA